MGDFFGWNSRNKIVKWNEILKNIYIYVHNILNDIYIHCRTLNQENFVDWVTFKNSQLWQPLMATILTNQCNLISDPIVNLSKTCDYDFLGTNSRKCGFQGSSTLHLQVTNNTCNCCKNKNGVVYIYTVEVGKVWQTITCG